MDKGKLSSKELLSFGSEELKKAHIEEASLDAWYVFEQVTGIGRTDYFLNPDSIIENDKAEEFLGL